MISSPTDYMILNPLILHIMKRKLEKEENNKSNLKESPSFFGTVTSESALKRHINPVTALLPGIGSL